VDNASFSVIRLLMFSEAFNLNCIYDLFYCFSRHFVPRRLGLSAVLPAKLHFRDDFGFFTSVYFSFASFFPGVKFCCTVLLHRVR